MTRKTVLGSALALVVAAALGGCVTLGAPFNAAQVPSITIGKTTRADVTKMFGQPFRTGVESGDETWTFVNYHFSVFGAQTAKDLYVRFNPNGTVKSYSYNSN